MLSIVQARSAEFKQADTDNNMLIKRLDIQLSQKDRSNDNLETRKLMLRCHYSPDASICESPVVEPTHIFHLYTN